MLGRRIHKERSNVSDNDLTPKSWNKMLRRIQRKREKNSLRRDHE